MTPEQWDTHWHRIREDAIRAGHTANDATHSANRETPEQFGPRPEPTTAATGRSGGRAISGGVS